MWPIVAAHPTGAICDLPIKKEFQAGIIAVHRGILGYFLDGDAEDRAETFARFSLLMCNATESASLYA
jgi:hypothetical protein